MNDILGIALSAAVSLRILELQQRGGPGPEDYAILPSIAQLLGEHGDDLLFKSEKKGLAAEVFNAAARGIATLAFAPGGVTVFGQHYEAVLSQ